MKKLFLIFILFLYCDSFSQWTRANAGVDGGVIFAIYADAGNNALYCGSNGSGAFKSINGGESWFPVNNGISDYGFYPTCFVSNGSNVFMGANYSSTGAGGMYKSTNGGSSWQKINSGLATNKAQRINKSINRGTDVYISTDSGVYRSTNSGSSWAHITSGINPVPEADALFFKGDSLYIGTSAGVYYSSGNFTNWTLANSGLPNDVATSFAFYNGNLYSSFFGEGVYMSTNNGASWSVANYNLTGSLLNLRCVYVFNNSLYVSCNGGVFSLGTNVWNSVSTGLPTESPFFYWLTSLPGKLITCTYARGVYVSTNSGSSWSQKVSGLTAIGTYTEKVIVVNNVLYAATLNNGVYKSTDNGMNWFASNSGLALRCNNIYAADNKIYALTDSGVYVTTNSGSSWNSLRNGLSGFDLKVYSMLKSGSTYFIGGYNGIMKSTNDGQSWSPSSFYSTQKNVVVIKEANGIIFAGLSPSTPSLIKSTDGGNNWSSVQIFTSFQPEVFDIFLDGTDIYLGTGHGVHRSSNNGVNWTMLNDGLGADPYVSSIIRVGTNLFCTQLFGGRGLFRSHNNGANWVDVTGHMFFTDYNQVFNIGGNIFVATGTGMFYQPQNNLTAIGENPSQMASFNLSQNYPNPFNPVTNIKYSIKGNEFVKINVYDITGRFVQELVNEYKQQGEYSINFNASALSSGIYYYTLQASGFIETKKMVLVK